MTTDPNRVTGLAARLWRVLKRNRRAVRDALVIVGLGRAFYYYVVQGVHPWEWVGIDARAYWRVDLAHPYVSSEVGGISSYLYPPIFAQVLSPLYVLPFPVFFALWTGVLLAILAWLVRPWPWALGIFAMPIIYELFVGNIHLLIAGVVVLGFAAPGLWAFPLLTKITPGVGLIWFVARREWRAAAVGFGVTGALMALSILASPTAWSEWFVFILANTDKGDAVLQRAIIAAGIVALAGLTSRRWLVPIGVWLAFPVIYVETWVVLLAIIRLRGAPSPVPESEVRS